MKNRSAKALLKRAESASTLALLMPISADKYAVQCFKKIASNIIKFRREKSVKINTLIPSFILIHFPSLVLYAFA
jgi:hypothetical protein